MNHRCIIAVVAAMVASAVADPTPSLRGSSPVPGPSCTGVGELPSATPLCYKGSLLVETLSVKVLNHSSKTGIVELKAVGPKHAECKAPFEKSAHSLTVTNTTDCGLNSSDFSVEYCPDQDEVLIHMAAPYSVNMVLSRIPCAEDKVTHDLANTSQSIQNFIACRYGTDCQGSWSWKDGQKVCQGTITCSASPVATSENWGETAWASIGMLSNTSAIEASDMQDTSDATLMAADTMVDMAGNSHAFSNFIMCPFGITCDTELVWRGTVEVCPGKIVCAAVWDGDSYGASGGIR